MPLHLNSTLFLEFCIICFRFSRDCCLRGENNCKIMAILLIKKKNQLLRISKISSCRKLTYLMLEIYSEKKRNEYLILTTLRSLSNAFNLILIK